jgi:branched-chain amino acid transport system substrate-binding protein
MDSIERNSTGRTSAETDNDTSGEPAQMDRRKFLRLGSYAGLAAATAPALKGLRPFESSSPRLSAAATARVKAALKFDPAYLGTGHTYHLGGILPLSGDGSFYGTVMTRGIAVAVEQIKALGGPTFITDLQDNQSGNSVAGITALRKLAGSGIQMMYSSYQADNHALLPGIRADKIFSLEIGQQDLSSTVNGVPYYWSAVETLSGSVPLMFKYISVAKPSVKKLFVVATDYGTAIMTPFLAGMTSSAEVIGASVVGSAYVPPGTTDFSDIIGQLSSASFDGVINYIQPGAGLFMRAFQEAGLSQPNFTVTVLPSDAVAGGSAMNGYTVAGLQFDATSAYLNPLATYFKNGYHAKYGTQPMYPEGYGAGAYDATFQFWQLIQAALKKKKPITGKTLNELASTVTIKSVFGGTTSKVGEWRWAKSHFPQGEQIAVYIVDDNGGGMKEVAVASGNGVTGFKLL